MAGSKRKGYASHRNSNIHLNHISVWSQRSSPALECFWLLCSTLGLVMVIWSDSCQKKDEALLILWRSAVVANSLGKGDGLHPKTRHRDLERFGLNIFLPFCACQRLMRKSCWLEVLLTRLRVCKENSFLLGMKLSWQSLKKCIPVIYCHFVCAGEDWRLLQQKITSALILSKMVKNQPRYSTVRKAKCCN